MKITNLETFHVKPRWMFLKISTDEGIVGWGEPVLEGRARTVEMAINELRPVLIGADPNAKKRVEQGFDAIKISPDAPVEHIDHLGYVDALAEKFCAIREAVGKNVDIAIDFHGRIMAGMASRLIDAIAPYYPMFVEEPVLPENVEVMASIAAKTSVPIATGERLFTK